MYFENEKGRIDKIREGHFKVTIFGEIGNYSFEERHADFDSLAQKHLY